MSLVKQREAFIRDIQAGMPIQASFRKNFPNGLSREQIMKEKANDEQKAGLMQVLGTVTGGTATAYGIPWIAGKIGGALATGGTGAAGGGAVAGGTGAVGGGAVAGGTGAVTGGAGTVAGTGAVAGGAGTVGTSAAGAGAAGAGGAGGAGATALPSLGAAAGPVAYAIAAMIHMREQFRKDAYETMTAKQRLKHASKDPINWLFPGATLVGSLLAPQNMWKTEQRKIAKLRDQGYNLPEHDSETLTRGRSKDELEALSRASMERGDWGNPIFAQSRNVADLSPIDVQGSASMYEQAGKGQENNARLRYELAKAALEAQAVREGYGSQTIDWSKVGNVDQIMKQYGNLGDKGQMSTDEWNRRNYEWLAKNNPNLAGLYDTIKGGAFKTSPRRDDKKK